MYITFCNLTVKLKKMLLKKTVRKRKYTYNTAISEKNPRICGPVQFKPVFFKGQL